MALKPEFIGLLRDIRDRIFPSVSTAHDDVVTKHSEVVELTNTLQAISVEQPVTIVPAQPNGEAGLPTVTYDNEVNEFKFGIPAGIDGQDLTIKYVVDLTADLYVLIPETGDVAYSNEDGKLYIKKGTGVNLNAADWTTGTVMTPTTTFRDMTDTPIEYTGFANYIVTVASDESKLVFRTVQDLTQPIADLKVDKSGDTMTGQLKGIAAVADEDFTIKSVVNTIVNAMGTLKASLSGATFTGQVRGITPIGTSDLTRKDYVDGKTFKMYGTELEVINGEALMHSGEDSTSKWTMFANGRLEKWWEHNVTDIVTWLSAVNHSYVKAFASANSTGIIFIDNPFTDISSSDSQIAGRSASIISYNVYISGVISDLYIQSPHTSPVENLTNIKFKIHQVGKWK